jgi:hypothetical protein
MSPLPAVGRLCIAANQRSGLGVAAHQLQLSHLRAALVIPHPAEWLEPLESCGVGEPGPVGNIWHGWGPFEWNLDRLSGWGLDLACLCSSVRRN